MSKTIQKLNDPVYFQVYFLGWEPHPKQVNILRNKTKNKVICCGRRGGKTKLISGELVRGAILRTYKKQFVVAPVSKQSKLVYDEIIKMLQGTSLFKHIQKMVISPYPTIIFDNGSKIEFGSAENFNSLRGTGYDRIFIDEAAFIKSDAWRAIRPMIFDTGAPLWQTSTPWGKDRFYQDFHNGLKGEGDTASFQFNSFDNPHLHHETIQKEIDEYGASSIYVRTEIYGEFVEDVDAYFKRELIMSCVDEELEEEETRHPKSQYMLGCDLARMGEDSSTFIVVKKPYDKENYEVIKIIETKHKALTDAIGRIQLLDKTFKFDKIFIDSTGLGAGVCDVLKERIGHKVIDYAFTIRSKENIYSNLKAMLEKTKRGIDGGLKLPNHKKMIYQLLDLRYEIYGTGNLKIHHSERGHDDFPDALALACFGFKIGSFTSRPILYGV
jgi:PBSX family phage terminase large subunit|tara:strand:+ start:1528 stop:2847 length:1320 start_codon:yes stop_codon:yes gene_type:complete